MPRKYDRTIRFYDSWFGDLNDPSKEFSGDEKWQIVLAIRDCQVLGSLEPLNNLPLSIRRALSMATMGEQIVRQLERAENMRKRGSAGGRAAAARERTPEEIAAAKIKAEELAREQREQEQRYDKMQRTAVKPWEMDNYYIKGAQGDAAALAAMKTTAEECKKICDRKGLKY